MRSRLLASIGILATLVVAPAAQAAIKSHDLVVARGTTARLIKEFSLIAASSPVGARPRGRVSFEQGGGEYPGPFHFEGTVSCLAVDGNRAVVGVDIDVERSRVDFQGYFITVVDGGPSALGRDTIHAAPSRYSTGRDFAPTDCALSTFENPIFGPDPLTSGGIWVRDARPRRSGFM